MALWDTEGDADTFEASGLHCMMRRDHNGVWAGYVAVPNGHPLHGKRRDALVIVPDAFAGHALDSRRIAAVDMPSNMTTTLTPGMAVPASVLLDVHGGVWFTGMLPDDGHWYIGFQCGHQWDYKPRDPMTLDAQKRMDPEVSEALFRTPADYRDNGYARNETIGLAAQLAALAKAQLADAPPSAPSANAPEGPAEGELRV